MFLCICRQAELQKAGRPVFLPATPDGRHFLNKHAALA
jgi:hypothetical protein